MMSASGLRRYREPMKISLPATLLVLATMVSTVHGYPVQDAKAVDEALASEELLPIVFVQP